MLHVSEADVWAVTLGEGVPFCELYAAGYRSLFGVGVPCDVWVRTREEVLREAPLPTTLTHKIFQEGRVLHG